METAVFAGYDRHLMILNLRPRTVPTIGFGHVKILSCCIVQNKCFDFDFPYAFDAVTGKQQTAKIDLTTLETKNRFSCSSVRIK